MTRLPRTVDYPDGVRSVDLIEESGPLVSLKREVDLDDLLLALVQEHPGHWERADEPTYIAGGYGDPEADVAWYRKQPCACGEDHGWDMAQVSHEKPADRRRYGAFLGVYIG